MPPKAPSLPLVVIRAPVLATSRGPPVANGRGPSLAKGHGTSLASCRGPSLAEGGDFRSSHQLVRGNGTRRSRGLSKQQSSKRMLPICLVCIVKNCQARLRKLLARIVTKIIIDITP